MSPLSRVSATNIISVSLYTSIDIAINSNHLKTARQSASTSPCTTGTVHERTIFFQSEHTRRTRPLILASCPLPLSIDDERMNSIDLELIEAAKENNLSEVRRLLSEGADVNVKDRHGGTPLHWACSYGHVQVFKELVEHGADIEAETSNGVTPLHLACWNDHLAAVIELLNPDDSNGTTTTILGKRKSRAGANTEAKDKDGNTPLHFASGYGHLSVVKALLSGGANMFEANNYGRLPIHLAVRFGKSAVSKYLLQLLYATTRRLPLHELVEDLTWIGDPDSGVGVPSLRYMLHQNVLDTDDVVEIVEDLVSRNPDSLATCDQDGSLPLHVACRRGASFAIVQSLVDHNQASVKSVTPQGDLPLFLACEIPVPSLDTIFLLMKLYPDLVYR
jgi:ankyrin repeat protein